VLEHQEYCWVLAFPNEAFLDHDHVKTVNVKSRREEIILALLKAGLAIKCHISSCQHIFFVLVGCPQLYLEFIATKMELPVKFEMHGEVIYADGTKTEEKSKGYKPFDMFQTQNYSGLKNSKGRFLFRSKARIQMVEHIMQERWDPLRHKFGAGLNLLELVAEPAVSDVFICHDHSQHAALTKLRATWAKFHLIFNFEHGMWEQPHHEIRDYFGEEIAMYFKFLGFYTSSLLLPVCAGIICQILYFVHAHTATDWIAQTVLLFYCTFVSLWACIYLQNWKQQETALAHQWGMLSLDSVEDPLPSFKGGFDTILDTYVYSKTVDPTRSRRLLQSLIAVMLCITVVAMTMTVYVILMSNFHNVKEMQMCVKALNAVTIIVANGLYCRLAEWLTVRENHRTWTEFTNFLIMKRFVFQFVNSYFTLYVTAFVKPFGHVEQSISAHHHGERAFISRWFGECSCLEYVPSGCNFHYDCVDATCSNIPYEQCHCQEHDCEGDVGKLLFVLLFVQLFVQNMMEVAGPMVYSWLNQKVVERKSGVRNSGRQWSELEAELLMPQYDLVFNDYNELILQFGYVTLFAANLPIVSLLAFINNMVEIRSDAYKLAFVLRRPLPKQAGSIGAWYVVMEIMSFAAVTANCAQVFCISRLCIEWDWSERIFAMFLFEHMIFGLKFTYMFFVPHITTDVQREIDHVNAMKQRAAMRELIERVDREFGAHLDNYISTKREPTCDFEFASFKDDETTAMLTELPVPRSPASTYIHSFHQYQPALGESPLPVRVPAPDNDDETAPLTSSHTAHYGAT